VPSREVDFPAVAVVGDAHCVHVKVEALGGFEAQLPRGCELQSAQSALGAFAWTTVKRDPLPVWARDLPASTPWRDYDVSLVVATLEGVVAAFSNATLLWKAETSVRDAQFVWPQKDGLVVASASRLVFVTNAGVVASNLDLGQLSFPCDTRWFGDKALVHMESGDLHLIAVGPFHRIPLPSLWFVPVLLVLLVCWVVVLCIVEPDEGDARKSKVSGRKAD
jgi:hypothetical protein